MTNEGVYSKALFESERFMPFSRVESIYAQKTKLFINDFANWEGNIVESTVLQIVCQLVNRVISKPDDTLQPSTDSVEEVTTPPIIPDSNNSSAQYELNIIKSDVAYSKIISNSRLDAALDLGFSLILGSYDSEVDKLHDRFLFLVTSTLKDFRKHVVENSGLVVFRNDFATYDVCSLIYNYTLIQILLQTKDECLCENIVKGTFRDKVFSYLKSPQKQSGFTQSIATRLELYVRASSESQLIPFFVMSLMSSNINEKFSSVDMIVQFSEDESQFNQLELLLNDHLPELKSFMDRLETDVMNFAKFVLDYKYSNSK